MAPWNGPKYYAHRQYAYLLADSVDRIRVTVTVGDRAELPCRKSGDANATTVVAEWKFREAHGQSASRVSLNRHVMRRFRRRFAVRAASAAAAAASNGSGAGDEAAADFSLVISPVRHVDGGLYTCLITDPSDELLRFVHLDVTGQACWSIDPTNRNPKTDSNDPRASVSRDYWRGT